MNESGLRREVAGLLKGDQAHPSPDRVFADLPAEHRRTRILEVGPSVWELLEHLRIAQGDILQYMLDPDWKSPAWPDGYWPAADLVPDDSIWQESLARFHKDLDAAIRLCEDERISLTDPIPHARKHTYLRELLLIADHNAYHLGQVVQIRKALGAWQG